MNKIYLLYVVEWNQFEILVSIGSLDKIECDFDAEDHIYDILDLD